MPRYGAAGSGGGRHGSARAGRGQGVVTVRSGCPELCPRARGSVRAGEGRGCGARGSTRRGRRARPAGDPGGCVGAEGHFPGGGGRQTRGSRLRRDGHPLRRPLWCAGCSNSERPALGGACGIGGWGAGICGFGSPKDPVSGARGPARRPLPLRQVFVQRPLCVCGRGWGLGSWPGDSPAS